MRNLARLAFLTLLLVGCGKQVSDQAPDPLLAAGEQAFIGSYKLDNVLLRPGGLVRLQPINPMFEGVGDTLEVAARKDLLTSPQVATMQQADCRLQVLADHTFTISNLPVADFSSRIQIQGTWSMSVYRVFEAYGYRMALKGGPKRGLVLAKFINADKPLPPVVEILYNEGQTGQVAFRFAKAGQPMPQVR